MIFFNIEPGEKAYFQPQFGDLLTAEGGPTLDSVTWTQETGVGVVTIAGDDDADPDHRPTIVDGTDVRLWVECADTAEGNAHARFRALVKLSNGSEIPRHVRFDVTVRD
jgi:hypothetical protein